MRRNSIRALLLAASGLASASAATAWAQTTPADETVVREVIVTTQRREERLQDVPISIATQTGEQLQESGVIDLRDIGNVTPGVKVDQLGNYLQPSIRGISTPGLVGPGTEQPVAVYLDGVYQSNPLINFGTFADLDRIEIAKGPQGTLFGRNATGGAISMYTEGPSFTPTGDFAVGYGNKHRATAQGFVAGPLVGEVLAGSLSAYYERHDSFDYDIARQLRPKDFKTYVFRGKLLFRPTEWAEITAIGSYQYRYDSDTASGVAPMRNTVANRDPTAIIATDPHTISFDFNSYLRVKSRTFTVLGKFDVGDLGTLSTISAYSRHDVYIAFDGDRAFTGPNGIFSAISYPGPDTWHSHEITFASEKFGPLSFLVGAYYSYSNNRFASIRVHNTKNPAQDFSFTSHNPSQSYAGFTEVNFDITPQLTAIAGIRYTNERRSNRGGVAFGPANVVGTPIKGLTREYDAWTPRFSLLYRVNEDTNLYATYSEGFKSGGVGSFLTQGPSYDPEKLKAIEVGIKSSPLPNLRFEVAAFHYRYSNLQVQVQETIARASIQNAAEARVKGIDAAATWRATPELTLSGGVSLLRAKYKEFPNASVLRPIFQPGIGFVGNATVSADVSGNYLTRAPKYTFSLVTDYRKELEIGAVGGNLTLYYSARVYYDSDNRINQGPFGQANALVFFEPRDSNFRFEVWGRNLTDKTYIQTVLEQTTADQVGYAPGRTYGATLRYSF